MKSKGRFILNISIFYTFQHSWSVFINSVSLSGYLTFVCGAIIDINIEIVMYILYVIDFYYRTRVKIFNSQKVFFILLINESQKWITHSTAYFLH